MNRLLFIFAFSLLSIQSRSQASKFTGRWSLVSVENTSADSSKSYPYGDHPKGLLIFEPNGDYAIQILKAVRPKVISNNKNTATPEENVALVQGNNSHYGQYAFDEVNHSVSFKVEAAFFPNWEGKELKSGYTLVGDVFKSFSNNTTNGGSSAVVTWKLKR